MPPAKDWSKIVRDLSSGEDSDEHDSLNLQSVTRNAQRVAQLVGGLLEENRNSLPPMGANASTTDAIRESLARATNAAARSKSDQKYSDA